jgi:glycosyltransferase involved in cell wall biosynthesis
MGHVGHAISFIITARNEQQPVVDATINGLLATSSGHSTEILLIDDGSDVPVAGPAGAVIVRNPEPIGVSRSRRQGASLATGEVLVWMDAHMSFAAGWLEEMLKYVDSGGLLCSAFWSYDQSTCHCWGADFAWCERNSKLQRYPGFAVRHRTQFPGSGAVEVPMVIGACYMMLNRSYCDLGGFCPLFRIQGGFEQDLSARAWLSGLSVRCVTDARVGHLWRPQFPYPIQFEHLEFNQIATLHTVFEESTVRTLDRHFRPYSTGVAKWLSETDFSEWRQTVQSKRQLSDADFIDRFVPDLKQYLDSYARARPSSSRRKISFIVTARDELPDILKATVDGLLETSADHDREIVVIDDGSLVPAAIERPHVRVERHATPVGVDQSRRHGAALSTGDVLVWLDAHMRFAPDWLGHMLAQVDSGALLCAAWWDYELTKPLCWGADFAWCAERNYHAGRSPGFTFRHRTSFPGDGAVEVPMAIGACYMTLRSSYEKLGGFSPFFRVWGKSEQDISARAWIMGLGVKCVTAARVGHLSRSQFPYAVRFEDLEFNEMILTRTIFQEPVMWAIDQIVKPLPPEVVTWLEQTNLYQWRQRIQSARTMSDAEFFRRFVPNVPESLLRAAQQCHYDNVPLAITGK